MAFGIFFGGLIVYGAFRAVTIQDRIETKRQKFRLLISQVDLTLLSQDQIKKFPSIASLDGRDATEEDLCWLEEVVSYKDKAVSNG